MCNFIKKWWRVVLFVIFIIVFAILSFKFLNTEVLLGVVALLISTLSIFQDKIKDFIFKPILIAKINIIENISDKEVYAKFFNINIQNIGFTSAKIIRIKIKSEENKEWLNLLRPFYEVSKETFLKKLTPGEEECFNFGNIYKGTTEIFNIICDIYANSQILQVSKFEHHLYFLEIVSDNTNPQKIKIEVNNLGFDCKEIVKIIK